MDANQVIFVAPATPGDRDVKSAQEKRFIKLEAKIGEITAAFAKLEANVSELAKVTVELKTQLEAWQAKMEDGK